MTSPRVALVAASMDILGGQGVQADTLIQEMRRDGVDARLIPINPRFPKPLQKLRQVRYARTVLNQALYLTRLTALRNVDVVHVFSASYWSFLLAPMPAIMAAKLLGKRVILNYHSGEAEDHLANWGNRVHPWLKLVDSIVVPSEYLREVFAEYGYDAVIIPNVLDLSRFAFCERRELQLNFISNRNFETHYQVDNTLRAFALIRERHSSAKLVVAGVGSLEAELKQLAVDLGLDDVLFVGRVEPEVMQDLLAQHDFFLNSSTIDNQPISVLEAFACGLAVISTPTGDLANMVRDGQTGVVIEPYKPVQMADAVDRLLQAGEVGVAMRRRAHEETSAYQWPNVRAAWVKVYSGDDR